MSYKDWIKCKISDLGNIVSGGTPSTKIADNWDGDISWITPKDLSGFNNRFISTGERKISDKGLANSSAKLMPKGSVLFSSRAPIGYVAVASKEVSTNQGFKSIVPNNNNYNIFIFYLLKYITDDIKSIAGGSTFSEISGTAFKNVEITIPKLFEQKAIANILSSLDEKIELNNRINKNLEELAQTLYKRWFVDFEFPNEDGEPYRSSGGEMVESELGLIPKGWNIGYLGKSSISKIIGSGIVGFYGNKKYIATADVTDTKITSFETEISHYKRPSRANMQPTENSLWFAKMKDSRKLIRVSRNSRFIIDRGIFSTGFAGIKTTVNALNYIWSYLISTDFDNKKNNLCNGTTMQAINNQNINKIKILVPSDDILQAYDQVTNDVFEKIQSNEIENNTFSKTRDLLLPKLMSGEIEVPLGE